MQTTGAQGGPRDQFSVTEAEPEEVGGARLERATSCL